jgi:hypothetical protein
MSIFSIAEFYFLSMEGFPMFCVDLRTKVGRDGASLRAGRSGEQISAKVRFSAPVRTGPGAHPTSFSVVTGLFLSEEEATGAWR